MGHYDSCRPGYCAGCGAAPGNMVNGKCPFCAARHQRLKDMNMRTAKRWTFEELDKLAKMIVNGTPINMIARTIGRTASAITSLRTKASSTRDALDYRIKLARGGNAAFKPVIMGKPTIMTVKPVIKQQVRDKLGKAKPQNHRAKWTDSQDLELVLNYNKGRSASELATLLGRTKLAIVGRLHTLGILTFDKDTMTYYTKPQHYYKIKVKA